MHLAPAQPSPALPRRRRAASGRFVIAAAALAAAVGFAAYNNVASDLTDEDRLYIRKILDEGGHAGIAEGSARARPFDEQIRIVAAVQDAVLSIAPRNEPIALDRPREPKDLYALRHGWCYDRTRSIEKALGFVGLRTRHAAVYSTRDTGNSLRSLLTPQIDSHAVTEVATKNGWMVVDPNARWIGLTAGGRAVTLAALQAQPSLREAAWDRAARDAINPIFRNGFTYVIGLYSRHGRFHAPYLPVPDISWRQLVENVRD
jgi:hypothetical protein